MKLKLNISILIILVVIPFLLPMPYMLKSVVDTMSQSIQFAEKEKIGNQYQRPLMELLSALSKLYILADSKKLDKEAQNKLSEEINSNFLMVEKLTADFTGDLQLDEQNLQKRGRLDFNPVSIKNKWETIKNDPYTNKAKITSIIADLRGLITHIGDTSSLILDPDLDSYYLMDVTLLALPQTQNRLVDVYSIAAPIIDKRGQISIDDQKSLATIARIIKEFDHDRVLASLATSLNEDDNFFGTSDTLKANLKPASEAYSASIQKIIEILGQIEKGAVIENAQLLSAVMASEQQGKKFFDVAVSELDQLFTSRIASFKHDQKIVLIATSIIYLFAVIFFILISRIITVPLKGIKNTLQDIATGKLYTIVPYQNRRDEIGEISKATEFLRQESVKAELLQEEKKKEVAAKELRQEKLREEIKNFNSDITESLKSVALAAEDLLSVAQVMSDVVIDAGTRTEAALTLSNEAATNVAAVASATEEMSASVHEIATQTSNSSQAVSETVKNAESAGVLSENLQAASGSIDEIVNMIQDIADKINLLALNATIESARAGEAGKGFAVVASEVKGLAQQTSKATTEISKQIREVQSVSDQVKSLIGQMKSGVEKINIFSSGVASAVEEQSAVTSDIARNMGNASGGVRTILDNINGIAASSKRAKESAEKVLSSSKFLTSEAGTLKNSVEKFLKVIATA